MNEHQLQSFVTAVNEGSFNKAAQTQFLSVPSFAQRINTLEGELGYSLFERGPHGVKPTPAGMILFEAAKQALSILDEAKQKGKASAHQEERVALGIWGYAPNSLIETMDELSKTSPHIHLEYVATSFNEAAARLLKDDFDMFFSVRSSTFDEQGFLFIPLCVEQYYCVFAPQSPLAQCDIITMDLLADITVYAGADYRSIPELAQYTSQFANSNIVKESIFLEKLLMDCVHGEAVSFFTESNYHKVCPPLEARPLDWPGVTRGIYLRHNAPQAAFVVAEACRKRAE